MIQAYELLEQELSSWEGVGQHKAVAVCNSGSSALQLALKVLGLPTGSKVLVPSFAFVACPRAVVAAGFEPVFVDCDENGLMDVGLVGKYLLDKWSDGIYSEISAIMPVHVFGRRCDMAGLSELYKKNKIAVVEDLAEAHGIIPHPLSDAAVWSFNRTKIILGEEGGAVAFKDRHLANTVRILRNQGHPYNDDTWYHVEGGGNYRLANALALPIRLSLADFRLNIELRRRMEKEYVQRCPSEWKMPERQSPWLYDIRIKGITRQVQDDVIDELAVNGIFARRGFRPLGTLPEFGHCQQVQMTNTSVASILFREVVLLPLTPLDPTRAERAFKAIKEVVK